VSGVAGSPFERPLGRAGPCIRDGERSRNTTGLRGAYRILSDRIVKFINLPMDGLDKRSIACKLEKIGRGS